MAKRVLIAALVSCSGVAFAAGNQVQIHGILIDLEGRSPDDFIVKIESLSDHALPKEIHLESDGQFKTLLNKGTFYSLDGKLGTDPLVGFSFKASSSSTQNLKVSVDQFAPIWNKWAKENGAKEDKAESLIVGKSYTITFDLAGLNYGKVLNENILFSQIDKDLAKYLANKEEAALVPKVFVQGDGLRLDSDLSGLKKAENVIAKLRATEENFKKWSDSGDKNLATLSDNLHAARFQVTVHAEKPGKSVIGLAIWSEERRQLLDIVYLRTTVTVAGVKPSPKANVISEPDKAQESNEDNSSQDGIRSLLNTASGPPATAGFGIFELDDTNTVVFYGPREIARTWQPRRLLRDFVSNDSTGHFGLVQQLALAHCPSGAASSCRESYSQVANLFSAILFSDPSETGRAEAQQAKEELEALVSLPQRQIVAVRYIDSSGAAQPIPFGLLGLSGDRLLGDFADISQPLKIERPFNEGDSGVCVKDFTSIVPTTLGMGNDRREQDDLDRLLGPLAMNGADRVAEFPQLNAFFGRNTEARPETPEGFLLIAHHADGFVSFKPSFSPALPAEAMTRSYAPGSVAILIGCSVGSLTPLNQSLPLVNTLNENGIDAMIFSPFSVGVEVGSRLAVHFSEVIEEARRAETPVTLFEIYRRALTLTRKDSAIQSFTGQLNEFSVLGNSEVKLCRAKSVPASAIVNTAANQPEQTENCPKCACSRPSRNSIRAFLGGDSGTGSTGDTGKPGLGVGKRRVIKKKYQPVSVPNGTSANTLGGGRGAGGTDGGPKVGLGPSAARASDPCPGRRISGSGCECGCYCKRREGPC